MTNGSVSEVRKENVRGQVRRWNRRSPDLTDIRAGASGHTSNLISAIQQYVTRQRIREVQDLTLKHIREMLTKPALRQRIPDPFASTIDARTWTHYMDSAAYEARKVSGCVSPEIMLSGRRIDLCVVQKQSISDVGRAIQRVDAWAGHAKRLAEFLEAGSKDLMLSPADTSISEKLWGCRVFQIRQSLRLLPAPSTTQSCCVATETSCNQTTVAVGCEVSPAARKQESQDLHLRSVTQDECADCYGGSTCPLSVDIIYALPGYFFDVEYLQTLAAVCRLLLLSAQSPEHWNNKTVHVDHISLAERLKMHVVTRLLAGARHVCVSVSQVVQFLELPANARLSWNPAQYPAAMRHNNFMFGFQSNSPLMGCADFKVLLPTTARGFYVGMQDAHRRSRTYYRVDNLFTDKISWSVSFNNAAPRMLAHGLSPLPDQENYFSLRWTKRTLSISLNNLHVLSERLPGLEPDASPTLSHIFMWVFGGASVQGSETTVTALASRMDLESDIRCALCFREDFFRTGRWAVCPVCYTWVCSAHVRKSPLRLCRGCVGQLQDYVGGSRHNTTQYEDLPVIYQVSDRVREMRIYRFGERLNCRLRCLQGEVPLHIVETACNNASLQICALPVHVTDNRRTLLFMATPFFPASQHRVTYCLFSIGDQGLEHAVVVPFLPRPSWDGLWAYLDIAYGLLKPRNVAFEIESSGFCFREGDDLAWLPPQGVARLTTAPNETMQIQLPPFNGTQPRWPDQEEIFVRWYESHATVLSIRFCAQRQKCSLCKKPLADFPTEKYQRLAREGRLGCEVMNICGLVTHQIRFHESGRHIQRAMKVPLCVHPSLLELHFGVKCSWGHEARQFELLPGSCTGVPTWQACSVAGGFAAAQGMSGDPWEFVDQEIGAAASELSREVALTAEEGGNVDVSGCRWPRSRDTRGGSLPIDIVLRLPLYYFSAQYLRSVALCSRAMLRAAKDPAAWANAVICVTDAEFQSLGPLRIAEQLWRFASHVILTIPQLAGVSRIPRNFRIQWSGWHVLWPSHSEHRVHVWESQTLLGSACFNLVAPAFTETLYIGVHAPENDRRCYCKLTWPFTARMTVDFGLNGSAPVRRTSQLPSLRFRPQHEVLLLWNAREFSVHLDTVLLSHATVLDGVPDAPPEQARVFVWAIVTPCPILRTPMVVRPLLTSIDRNVSVRCHVCGFQGSICPRTWGVCTLCQSWACWEHIQRNPLRRCPLCVALLEDYLGGKTVETSAAEHLAELLIRDDEEGDFVLFEPQPVQAQADFVDWEGFWDLRPDWLLEQWHARQAGFASDTQCLGVALRYK